MCACVHISKIITVCFSHSTLKPLLCTQATQVSLHTVWVCVCVLGSNRYTHTYMPILKKKKKHAAGVASMMPQPQSHTTSAVTHVSNTSSYSEIPQKKRKTRSYRSPLKQMESHSIRGPAVSVFLSLCLHLILEGKPPGAQKKKKKKGLRFHSDPRNEITNPIITRMLHGSPANRLRWVIYLMLFFFFSFFNLSLPWWDYSLSRTVYHRKTY